MFINTDECIEFHKPAQNNNLHDETHQKTPGYISDLTFSQTTYFFQHWTSERIVDSFLVSWPY